MAGGSWPNTRSTLWRQREGYSRIQSVCRHRVWGRCPRVGDRKHAQLIDAMRDHHWRDPDPMTLRRGRREHPFGTMNAWMCATHFPTRHLTRVKTEMALKVMGCDITRMVALIGIGRLIEATPADRTGSTRQLSQTHLLAQPQDQARTSVREFPHHLDRGQIQPPSTTNACLEHIRLSSAASHRAIRAMSGG